MSRPTKLTEITVKKLEDAFIVGATIEEACFNANISRQTYYNWRDEKPELFDRIEQLRMNPVLEARKSLLKGIKKDPVLAFRFLSRLIQLEQQKATNEEKVYTKIEVEIINEHKAFDNPDEPVNISS